MKPPVTCRLVKGKLIDVQENFVDTFNWLVECASKVKGVSGITITGIDTGNPKVKLNLSLGDGLKLSAKNVKDGGMELSLNLEAGDGIEIGKGKKGALKITGTSGISVGDETGCKGIKFESEDDSNVTFEISKGSDDVATVKVGVYYAD